MAENEKTPEKQQPKPAPTPTIAKAEFSKKLTEKYDISPALQPSRVDFGSGYMNITTDLREDGCLAIIDRLVKSYPDQPYFKAKK